MPPVSAAVMTTTAPSTMSGAVTDRAWSMRGCRTMARLTTAITRHIPASASARVGRPGRKKITSAEFQATMSDSW